MWKWTKVSEDLEGDTYYVDFQRIRKHDSYVYWWVLTDFLKPDEDGDLSYKAYHQGDCKLFRYKYLSVSRYKEPMGSGSGFNVPTASLPKDWNYPSPKSSIEIILKAICKHAE